jgi:serine/threonine protein kinase
MGEFSGHWALKELKRSEPRQAYERFVREVTAIKKLTHSYIIRIVDHSMPEDEFQFYVMEYFDGAKPLGKIIFGDNNPFYADPLPSLDLFERLCEALLACETCSPSIVHRDLSPANILVCSDGKPKIIDFGLCQIQGHERITLVDEGVGTVNYMAPECESGSTERIAIGADLYSAGKILWSAVTGMRAFSRENPAFNGKSMPDMFPDSPSTWHLHHIFEKTIRRDWRNRWGSAKDAVLAAKRVKYLIESGYPPLEEIRSRCPLCGVGGHEDFQGSHMVFGNPNPHGIISRQCSYCGFCFALNIEKFTANFERRKQLE